MHGQTPLGPAEFLAWLVHSTVGLESLTPGSSVDIVLYNVAVVVLKGTKAKMQSTGDELRTVASGFHLQCGAKVRSYSRILNTVVIVIENSIYFSLFNFPDTTNDAYKRCG